MELNCRQCFHYLYTKPVQYLTNKNKHNDPSHLPLFLSIFVCKQNDKTDDEINTPGVCCTCSFFTPVVLLLGLVGGHYYVLTQVLFAFATCNSRKIIFFYFVFITVLVLGILVSVLLTVAGNGNFAKDVRP